MLFTGGEAGRLKITTLLLAFIHEEGQNLNQFVHLGLINNIIVVLAQAQHLLIKGAQTPHIFEIFYNEHLLWVLIT